MQATGDRNSLSSKLFRRGVVAEFVKEPAASNLPYPGRWKAGIFRQAGPIQIPCEVPRRTIMSPQWSSFERPRRLVRPMTHSVCCPSCRFVFVTRRTCVRYLVFVCHGRRNEFESVCAHKGTGNAFTLDLWHMAGHALTAGAAVLVMSVFFHFGYVRAVRRCCTVAIEAYLVCGLAKLSIVLSAVYIMARSACNSFLVHQALHEVITLHPVLMRSSIRKMSKGRLSQCMVFEFPVVRKAKTDAISDRPIVSLAFDLLG